MSAPPWWAGQLTRRRDAYNAELAAARVRGAEPDALGAALREVGGVLADGAGAVRPHQPVLAALADALVPAACALVAERRWARGQPERDVLLAAALLGAHLGARGEQAAGVVADLVLAASRVRRWGDAAAWQRRLLAAAAAPGVLGAAVDPGVLRGLGVVAAWRSGCVRLRAAALGEARRLPPDAVRTALDLPPAAAGAAAAGEGDRGLRLVLDRHTAQPWWWPGAGASGPAGAGEPPGLAPHLRFAARVGGFRGLGGPWVHLPRVLAGDGVHWDVLTDDPRASAAAGPSSAPGARPRRGERWVVTADVHGSAVHRWGPGGSPAPGDAGSGALHGDRLRVAGVVGALPWSDDVTGVAAAGDVAVLSRAHSYCLDVVVVAR